MAFMTTVVAGTEYGAEYDGPSASGMFTRRTDGTWQQHRGTSQTPTWRTESAFRRWVLRETRQDRLGVLMPSGKRIKFDRERA